MTLIVGRAHRGNTYIVGDTALAYADKRAANPLTNGCLKIYRVQPTLAVAFAGNQAAFEQIAPDVLAVTNSRDAIAIAAAEQQRGADFELLVADACAPHIWIIKDGTAEPLVAGFIGDRDTFNEFQAHFHSTDTPDTRPPGAYLSILELAEPHDDKTWTNMVAAIKRVIEDPNLPQVGGLVVPLATRNGVFAYMRYADVVTVPPTDVGPEPKPIDFGTAQIGGYAVEICDDWQDATGPPDCRGSNVGFYFLQGGFGVVFPESKTGVRTAEVIRAANPAFWEVATAERLGRPLLSQYVHAHHVITAGEHFLNAGRYQDALFCYAIGERSLRDVAPAVVDRYQAGYGAALFNVGDRLEAVTRLRTQIAQQPDSPWCKGTLGGIQ